ncbi:odorant receptor 45b-like [Cimex lectularius]|uniref:Odorant receptor n=1 Tax=Cimex lectularius TaxID=79782 RepID=A0A8I6S994_CIMLE|nr:odorant receptor 45b-like [Cimex lectularius]
MERLEESDLVDGLSVNYMKYSGLWTIINEYRETGRKNAMLKIGVFITMIFLCPFITFSLSSFFVIEVDFQAATMFVLNPCSCIQSVLKVLVFWFGLESQCQILNMMRKDFLNCIPKDKEEEANEIMKNIAHRSNYFCVAGITANTACVLVWNFIPVLRSQYFREELNIKLDNMETNSPNKILGGWYPFNYTVTPWSEGVYVFEFIVCAWAGFVISLHECILIQLVMLLWGHLKVVSFVLSNIRRSDFLVKKRFSAIHSFKNYEDDSINSSEAVSKRMNDHLLICLKDHQHLMKVGDQIRDLYNFLITAQLGTGLLIMIITVFHFQYYGTKDALFTVKFVVYLGYCMVENVLYCYCGAYLEAASEEVGMGFYSGEWYKGDVNYRKIGQMLMVRSLRPVSLIAVQLYPVNLTTLTSLLQLTYSSSALMSRFINDN